MAKAEHTSHLESVKNLHQAALAAGLHDLANVANNHLAHAQSAIAADESGDVTQMAKASATMHRDIAAILDHVNDKLPAAVKDAGVEVLKTFHEGSIASLGSV